MQAHIVTVRAGGAGSAGRGLYLKPAKRLSLPEFIVSEPGRELQVAGVGAEGGNREFSLYGS
jgi:hypothetical protein